MPSGLAQVRKASRNIGSAGNLTSCKGAERPDALERKHMQRLALWSREQMIASYLGTVTAATGAAENSMQFKCSSIAEQNGPSRVRLFSTLRAPSEFSESAPFDFICRVSV